MELVLLKLKRKRNAFIDERRMGIRSGRKRHVQVFSFQVGRGYFRHSIVSIGSAFSKDSCRWSFACLLLWRERRKRQTGIV